MFSERVSGVLVCSASVKGAAVHVIDDTRVPGHRLTAAVDGCSILVTAIVQCVNSLEKPSVLQVALIGISNWSAPTSLTLIHVHGHAVCGACTGILIVACGIVPAGRLNGSIVVSFLASSVHSHSGSHNALARIGNQTLGDLQQCPGSGALPPPMAVLAWSITISVSRYSTR